jgi:chloramphenicol-sensitive protein RarD
VKPLLKGVIFAAVSYLLWGLLPVYWHLLRAVSPFHILAYRIIFSFVFTACLLFFLNKRRWLRHFFDTKKHLRIILGGLLISCNWGLYIWAVNSDHTVEASLGYFMNPLLSILLGLVFFRERLKKLQWLAFVLAAAGVTLVTVFSGVFPWISLLLALSFALYSTVKKTLSFDPLEALAAETLAAVPVAVFFLAFSIPDGRGFGDVLSLPPHLMLTLFLAGPVTAIPLYLFARGAQLLPFSTLGFIQFINPTMLFITGVFIFREPFLMHSLFAYGLIWIAALFYCLSFVSVKNNNRLRST